MNRREFMELLFGAPLISARTQQDPIAALEDALDRKRRQVNIQGLSVVIVRDDQILMMKGFGSRDTKQNLPVTPDTLFAIGSCTKAFTAMVGVIGADEGKLSLDDSPRKYLPYFKLRDPEADATVTIRDLLCHRTGIAEDEAIWASGHRNREEVIRKGMTAKPTAPIRTKLLYNNIMFSSAGEAIARAHGSTWEDLVAKRIFRPLGMNATNTSVQEMESAPDYSVGYGRAAHEIRMRDLTNIAPAGAINSNARDMSRWLRLMLNGGVFEGRRLVSESGFRELTARNIETKQPNVYYGLGWGTATVKGHFFVSHTGGIDGFTSVVDLMPDLKLGWNILFNTEKETEGNSLRNIILSQLVRNP